MNTTEPSLGIRIDFADGRKIGPGKIALLKAIAQEGSIAAAARALNMSYRRAWLLVDETAQIAGAAMVDTAIGGKSHGGAQLTDAACEIIALYDQACAEAAQGAAATLERFRELCAGGAPPAPAKRAAR